MAKNKLDKIELILAVIIGVAILGTRFLGDTVTAQLIQWLISALVGAVLSMVAESIVEGFTGDFRKEISFPIDIFGFKLSIPVFFIATGLVKYTLLR